MALVEKVKTALRTSTSNTGLLFEIGDLIVQAKEDLAIAGIDVSDDTMPLIERAIILYARINFDLVAPDRDRDERAYLMLKQHLSLSEDYKAVVV